MIKLRLSLTEENEQGVELEIVEGELLTDAVKRILTDVPLNDRDPADVFNAVVNGLLIEKEFWKFTALKADDNVMISIRIESGDSGQIFKQIAIIVIIAVATYFLGPAGAGLSGGWLAAATATVAIGASLLMNALIPPPVPSSDVGGLYGGSEIEDSQMYSISGQANTVKRFGNVPRVYGSHRMFPNVAANPYTQLETDPLTGEPVQFLYAIYDFGFGPAMVTDLKIGDTPILADNFNDFTFNFFDYNKPEISEGPWDDLLNDRPKLYKGDVEGTSLAIAIDGNEIDDDAQDTWQAIRNCPTNADNVLQEITCLFVNTGGLYGFNSSGSKGGRQIDLDISFSKADEDVWRKYNDPDYTVSSDSAGGDDSLFERNLTLASEYVPSGSTPTSGTYYTFYGFTGTNHYGFGLQAHFRIRSGVTQLLVIDDGFDINPGTPIKLNNNVLLGYVLSTSNYGPNPDYIVLNLDRPIDNGSEVMRYMDGLSWSQVNLGSYLRLTNATPGRARIKSAEGNTTAYYSSFRFTPNFPGEFKVRIRRLSTSGQFNTTKNDNLVWSSITSRFDRPPIITDKRHVFLEIKIKATGQINGNISDLSGVVQSVVDVYDSDTATWAKATTNNPAWAFCDLLTSEINKKAVSKDRLHMDSIVEWAEFCDEIPDSPPGFTNLMPRFECNYVLDYSTTLQAALNQIGSGAQASLNIIDGKYGVLIDQRRTTPVQIFTPRNSRDFQSTRFYGPRPHALKVKYIDPGLNWEVTEVIVYDAGFTESNATEFDELTSFACTNHEQAWRFGRYMLAQNRLRQETISLLVDFEYLVCTRGDYVQITQDVMRVGGTPARVKTVVGSTVTIDDAIDTVVGSYGYVYRSTTGEIKTDTLTVTDPRTFELDGDLPAPGDLIVIGIVDEIIFDCVVKAISPNEDMSASLTLVEKADAIYDAESTDTVPVYDPHISRTSNPDLDPPLEVENLTVLANTWKCAAGGYEYYIDLTWTDAPGSVSQFYNIYVDSGQGYNEVGRSEVGNFRYIVDQTRLDKAHSLKVIAVSASGRRLPLGSVTAVTATPLTKLTPPSDITLFSSDVTNEVLQLSWPAPTDCDIAEYVIRYSPDTAATWDRSIPLLRVAVGTNLASTQARTGTYLIKAIDFNGNQSTNAAACITTIPNLFNLNVIETIQDAPDFLGTMDRVVKLGSGILLDEMVHGSPDDLQYYTEGFYNYAGLLDLGEVFTVRLQSLTQAEGFTNVDLMSEWETLEDVLSLSTTSYAQWSLETQYRSATEVDFIDGWVTLSSIPAIGTGIGDQFSEWRTFFIGDATGRIFQFRLKLISNQPNVSPRVFDATIKADMPDRVYSEENLTANDTIGKVVAYDPAFYGPGTSPNVQISIDGGQAGDYWTFTDKTLEGFTIKFFDSTDTQVERQFDYQAKGYGHKFSTAI